jgi:tetratricopeptide (TPR) repeat protein
MASERSLVENRFEEGMALYRQGRLVEASERWEESVKLSPGNLKARYWLKRVRGELADEHFRRGQKAYQMHRLRDSLDQWYAALVLNPKFPQLVTNISRVESELRRQEANDKLQEALNLYGQGRNDQALKLLEEVLQIEPGETKAQKLISEIRLEIANQYVTEGRSKYKDRQYKPAIDSFNKAVDNGYDPRKANHLIALAKEQMNKEVDLRRKRIEDERRKQEEEEARRKAEEDRKKKSAEEAAQAKQQDEKKQQLDAKPPEPEQGAPAQPPNAEENKRSAIKYWQQGLQAFQRSDYQKARDEWMLCKQFDPSNSDCIAGLQRIDNTYGGGQ